jgi:aspartate aminotransferase
MDLSEYFLDEHLLATVPGSSFGLEGYMRISFANSLEALAKCLDRLESGFKALG